LVLAIWNHAYLSNFALAATSSAFFKQSRSQYLDTLEKYDHGPCENAATITLWIRPTLNFIHTITKYDHGPCENAATVTLWIIRPTLNFIHTITKYDHGPCENAATITLWIRPTLNYIHTITKWKKIIKHLLKLQTHTNVESWFYAAFKEVDVGTMQKEDISNMSKVTKPEDTTTTLGVFSCTLKNNITYHPFTWTCCAAQLIN
jgi:hypothetical protein